MEILSSGWVVTVGFEDNHNAAVKSRNHTFMFFQPTEKSEPLSLVLGGSPEALEELKGREFEWTKKWASGYFSEVFFSSNHFRENTGRCSLQQWMKEFSSKLATVPMSKSSDICQPSTLIGPSTILIGDAGHSAGARGGMGSVLLDLSFHGG